MTATKKNHGRFHLDRMKSIDNYLRKIEFEHEIANMKENIITWFSKQRVALPKAISNREKSNTGLCKLRQDLKRLVSHISCLSDKAKTFFRGMRLTPVARTSKHVPIWKKFTGEQSAWISRRPRELVQSLRPDIDDLDRQAKIARSIRIKPLSFVQEFFTIDFLACGILLPLFVAMFPNMQYSPIVIAAAFTIVNFSKFANNKLRSHCGYYFPWYKKSILIDPGLEFPRFKHALDHELVHALKWLGYIKVDEPYAEAIAAFNIVSDIGVMLDDDIHVLDSTCPPGKMSALKERGISTPLNLLKYFQASIDPQKCPFEERSDLIVDCLRGMEIAQRIRVPSERLDAAKRLAKEIVFKVPEDNEKHIENYENPYMLTLGRILAGIGWQLELDKSRRGFGIQYLSLLARCKGPETAEIMLFEPPWAI